jgi:cell division septation protein DedD
MSGRWRHRLVAASLTLALTLAWPGPATAQGGPHVIADEAEISFPESVVFSLSISNAAAVEEIELEYGMTMQSCGAGTAKARPDFQPGSIVHVAWTWNLRESNSPPAGTEIWWRWHLTDASGQVTVTETQVVSFDDPNYAWLETRSDTVVLFSAVRDTAVNQALWDAVQDGLDKLEEEAGARPARLVKIYNYPDTNALRGAIVHTHDWTGALALPAFDTILLAANASNLEWALRSAVHELTHLVVHQDTFNCLGADMPTWLDEGLAVYFEGDADEYEQELLDSAIAEDDLLSLQSIASGFPTDADRARLAYAESRAIVAYLLETYGREAMGQFLSSFAAGASTSRALQEAYGLEIPELENAWRASVGLQPREVIHTQTPSPIPTIAPYQAPTATETPTAEATATPHASETPTPVPPTDTPTATQMPVMATSTPTPTPPSEEGPAEEGGGGGLLLAGAGAVGLGLAVIVGLIWRGRGRPRNTPAD